MHSLVPQRARSTRHKVDARFSEDTVTLLVVEETLGESVTTPVVASFSYFIAQCARWLKLSKSYAVPKTTSVVGSLGYSLSKVALAEA